MDNSEKIQKMGHIVDTVMLKDTIQGIEILIDGKKDNKKYLPIDEAFAITEYILTQIAYVEKKDVHTIANTLKILMSWREMLLLQLREKENS